MINQERHSAVTEASVAPAEAMRYHFCLYVVGQASKSLAAINNLTLICEQHLNKQYEIEVIDLLQTPGRAAQDQIVAIPTLVRRRPLPLKRIIGTLSNTDQILIGLGIRPKATLD